MSQKDQRIGWYSQTKADRRRQNTPTTYSLTKPVGDVTSGDLAGEASHDDNYAGHSVGQGLAQMEWTCGGAQVNRQEGNRRRNDHKGQRLEYRDYPHGTNTGYITQ